MSNLHQPHVGLFVNRRSKNYRHAVVALALSIATLGLPACGYRQSDKPHKQKPAKVEKIPQETEIALITLTDKAEQRLGISLTKIKREKVQRRRVFGGEVTIPGGKSIIVSAPIAGTIAAPDSGEIPLPGARVKTGDAILTLLPLLTPERDVPTPVERVQIANARATLLAALTVAKGEVDQSVEVVDGAKIALDRAKQLFDDGAGSKRAVDDAQVAYNVAQSQLQAAKERQNQMAELVKSLETGPAGKASPIPISSPQSGVVRNLSVSRGQTVSPGAAMFEVVDTDTMWIRVPIYVDLVSQIDSQANAAVTDLGSRSTDKIGESTATEKPENSLVAQPVAAPPTADPLSTTTDLYYEVSNANNLLRPGQRVGVEVQMRGADNGLVVSAKSILYDIYGGAWVYVKSAEHKYQRQRVLIRYTENDRTVLAEGPEVGTDIVVDGAAELYGTEFGAGK